MLPRLLYQMIWMRCTLVSALGTTTLAIGRPNRCEQRWHWCDPWRVQPAKLRLTLELWTFGSAESDEWAA